MATFDFELVFTGMCLIELDQDQPTTCTVHIPDASRPDVVFSEVPLGKRPARHVPRLSFATKFQVSGGSGPMRPVDRVYPAPDGEEIGVCNLESEELTLVPPANSSPLTLVQVTGDPLTAPRTENLFCWTAKLQDLLTLSNCTFSGVDLSAVATQVHLANGHFGTLECGRQNNGIVVYEYDQVRGNPQTTPGRCLADAVVLRLEGLDSEVCLRSPAGDFFFFPPTTHAAPEVVRVCISNFHEKPEPHDFGLYDFLWYYKALAGLNANGKTPDPMDLFVPYIPQAIPGGPVCGSSGHCPPAVVVGSATAGTEAADAQAFALAAPGSATAVIGPPTLEGEFPGSVALLDHNGALVGSGVLLDGDIVLSAGHVLDQNPTMIAVGNSFKSGQRFGIQLDSRQRPNGFGGGTFVDDLLLFRLTTTTSQQPPRCAATAEIDSSSAITVVGFGYGGKLKPAGIQRKSDPLVKVLRAKCPISDPSGCHAGLELVADETQSEGVDSGDSGSPAYVEVGGVLKLAAIASRTTVHNEGIYVRLDAYADWIARTIASLRGPVVPQNAAQPAAAQPATPKRSGR